MVVCHALDRLLLEWYTIIYIIRKGGGGAVCVCVCVRGGSETYFRALFLGPGNMMFVAYGNMICNAPLLSLCLEQGHIVVTACWDRRQF